jgi:hypothetical protein
VQHHGPLAERAGKNFEESGVHQRSTP